MSERQLPNAADIVAINQSNVQCKPMESFSNLVSHVLESAQDASERQQSAEEKASPASRLKRKRAHPGQGDGSKSEAIIVLDDAEEISSEEDDSDAKRSRAIYSPCSCECRLVPNRDARVATYLTQLNGGQSPGSWNAVALWRLPCWDRRMRVCTVTPLCAGPWSRLSWLPLKNVAKGISESLLSKFRSLFTSGLNQQKPVASDHSTSIIKSLKGLSCRYPNHDGSGVLRIESRDLESLQDRSYVNDTIVDYYIKLKERSQSPDIASRLLFCNCFFFKKFCEGLQGPRNSFVHVDDAVRPSPVNCGVVYFVYVVINVFVMLLSSRSI